MFPIGDQNEPGRGIAWVTLALIAANVIVFLLLQQGGADQAFTYGYSAIPFEVTHGVDLVGPVSTPDGVIPMTPGPSPIQLTLLTSLFMHGSWLHIGGNMLFLWIFGDNVEHRMGAVAYLLFYLAAGVIASLAQIMLDPASRIPTLGASGAISGVLGAYIVLYPTNQVTVFVLRFLTRVPAVAAIGIWIVLQFLDFGASVQSQQTSGGVAYMAHIGGFAAGLLVGLVLRAVRPEPPPPRRPLGAWR